MTEALLYGLGAAVGITISLVSSSRSIRMIGNLPVLAWVMLVGLLALLPAVIRDGIPSGLTTRDVTLLVLVGACQIGGFLLSFAAMRVGKVGVVTPIFATEGAVAAVISAVGGERLSGVAVAMLATMVVGVVVAGAAPDPNPIADERPVASVVLAVSAAVVWGTGLFLVGQLSDHISASWIVLPPRLLGTLIFTIPLLVTGRHTLTRKAAPLVIVAGLAEVVVNVFIALGSRSSVAITSVMASQYAVLSPLAAWLLFRETLGRQQLLGAALLVIGVTGIALAH